MKHKTLINNTILLYIMTAAKYVLPFIITAILTRRLEPKLYGSLIYINTMINYFISLFDFGFNYSAVKKIAENKHDNIYVSNLYSRIILNKLILSGIGFTLLCILTSFIPILKHNLSLTLIFYVFAITNIFVPDFIYRGLEKMKSITLRYILSKTIAIFIILICVKNSKDILIIPVAYIIGQIIAISYANKELKTRYGIYPIKQHLKDALPELRDSTPYFISLFASMSFNGLITLSMGIANIPAIELAYMGLTLQIINAVQALYEPITGAFYPNISRTKDYNFVIKATIYLTIIAFIGLIALYFCTDIVIKILSGSKYMLAERYVKMFMPMLLFAFPSQMLGFPFLGSAGKIKELTKTTVTSAMFLLIGTIILFTTNTYSLNTQIIIRNVAELILLIQRIYYTQKFIKRGEMQ